MPPEYSRLDANRLRSIRADLDKQTPEQRAKAEKKVRKQVEKAARNPEERKSFLSYLFGKDS